MRHCGYCKADVETCPHEYGVAANICEVDRVLRMGAKVEMLWQTGGPDIHVRALSRGGRRVNKWVPLHRLTNFRAKWMPEYGVTKEDAEKIAANMQKWADRERAEHPNRRGQYPDFEMPTRRKG